MMAKGVGAKVPELVRYVRLDAVEAAARVAIEEGETLWDFLQALRPEEFEADGVLVLPEDIRSGSVISEDCELTIQEVVLPIWETLRGVLRRLEELSRHAGEAAVVPPAPTDESLSFRLYEILQTMYTVRRLEGAPDDDDLLAAMKSLMDLTEAVPVALKAKELLRELCDELRSALANLRQVAADQDWGKLLKEDRRETLERGLRCLAGSSGRTDEGDYRIPSGWAIGLGGLPPHLKDDLMRLVIADQ